MRICDSHQLHDVDNRLTEAALDEGLGQSSYWFFTVTMTLSCVVSEIKRDIGRKIAIFLYATCIRLTPCAKVFRPNALYGIQLELCS